MTHDYYDPVEVPWLNPAEIASRAGDFLRAAHSAATIPIPVELIVEREGLDIVPVPSLRAAYDLDGGTSLDCKRIFVDSYLADAYETRYRFTLAHELGHVILHRDLFRELANRVTSTAEWLAAHADLSDMRGGSLEWQANCFAGHLLVPDHHLRCEFENARQEIGEQIRTAVAQGIDRPMVVDVAWESLVMRLAQPFRVSRGVIERRLKFEGITSADL